MKKIVAIILSLVFALSLAACQNSDNNSRVANDNKDETFVEQTDDVISSVDVITQIEQSDDESVEEDAFANVNSFDQFKEIIGNNYKPTITETEEEGVIIVDVQTPTTDKDTNKESTDTTTAPAIPTIDKTPKPQEPSTNTDDTPATDNTSSEPEVVEPTPEPSEPEPTPTPDIETPTPQPEPEKPQQPEYTYTTGQKHEKLHYTERYLYSILNAEQKSWYQAIDTAVNNLDSEVLINSDLSIDRNYYIYHTYLFDNPEHFYLCNTVGLYNKGDGTTVLSFYYSVGNQKGEYCGYGYGPLTEELKNKIRAKKATFEAEANRILSTIPANAPDVWKERLIYDRILKDGHYNLGAQWDGLANDNWTSYGLLVNKYGVCESYSEAFQTLCLYAGIKCTGVIGTAGGGHKWNAVELDGEWYMCDVTFDDPIGGEAGAAYHYYFNRTSEWFAEGNHNWSNCEFSVPECNGTKYDFDKYFGESRWG